jgi:putative ABC transport system ATP-binding protein
MSGPLVQTINVTKRYRVGKAIVTAVSDVSLTVNVGEFIAIQGRSGSGKTTLMNIVGILDRADSGRQFIGGDDVAVLSERARTMLRNQHIGFVFQMPTLLPRSSALENVELPLAYAGVRGLRRQQVARVALERVGLGDRCNHWPSQLSGGEQQRVAIARALVNRPSLILADEPTGALDSNTGDEILSLFEALHRDGTTIILVTHAPDVAERALRRVTLHDGRIIEDRRTSQQVPAITVLASGTSQ